MQEFNKDTKQFTQTNMPKFNILSGLSPEEIKRHDIEITKMEQEAFFKARTEAFRGCGINEDALHNNFNNYKAIQEKQKIALSKVWDFAKKVISGEFCTLILYGCPGSGKTHLVTACLNFVMHQVKKVRGLDGYYTGRYVLSRNISSQLMDTFSYSSKVSYDNVINNFCYEDLLVIDEIGRDIQAQSGENSGLFAIIDKRKSKNKSIAMCTNCNWNEFQIILGSAAMSRLLQKSIIVNMSGIPDYRLQHHDL